MNADGGQRKTANSLGGFVFAVAFMLHVWAIPVWYGNVGTQR
jgi:hypothetical protein